MGEALGIGPAFEGSDECRLMPRGARRITKRSKVAPNQGGLKRVKMCVHKDSSLSVTDLLYLNEAVDSQSDILERPGR